MEVEGAGEHEAALGTALVLHLHQLADVRLEIQIRRILFLTISVQYFLTSSNTDSLTAFLCPGAGPGSSAGQAGLHDDGGEEVKHEVGEAVQPTLLNTDHTGPW